MQGLVLFSHFYLFDLLFCVYIHKLILVKIPCSPPIDHGFTRIPIICTQFTLHSNCFINHEAFEVWIRNTLFQHHVVQLLPQDTLSVRVFKLHVTNGNCHHFIINWIIHMVGEIIQPWTCFTWLNIIQASFEITTKLHPLNQAISIVVSIHKHLEQENIFSRLLS
jgi:hypothetical protein